MKKNNTVGRHERSEARQKYVDCYLLQHNIVGRALARQKGDQQ